MAKFDPANHSLEEIGPDVGMNLGGVGAGMGMGAGIGGGNFKASVMARDGCIYCLPCRYGLGMGLIRNQHNPHNQNHGHDNRNENDPRAAGISILKIDTKRSVVEILNDVHLPEVNWNFGWISGVLASDDCLYFMPCDARRILKLDPRGGRDDGDNNGNGNGNGNSVIAATSVGDDLLRDGGEGGYKGMVAGDDGYLYGIPSSTAKLVRFNPIDESITHVLGETRIDFTRFHGAIIRDGFIYAINAKGLVLEIDLEQRSHTFIENTVLSKKDCIGWGRGILGNDRCIYWPPSHAHRTLKFDPETRVISLVGDYFFGEHTSTANTHNRPTSKWCSGAVGPNGAIYCIPYNANQVLSIDPFKEFTMTFRANMKLYPKELGRLFIKTKNGQTVYQCAVRNFQRGQISQLIEDCVPSHIAFAGPGSRMESFMVAASCRNSAVSVIFSLLCKNLDSSTLVNCCTFYSGSTCREIHKKRKRK